MPPTKLVDSQITDSIIGEGSILKSCSIHHCGLGVRSRIESDVVLNESLVMGSDFYESAEERIALRSGGGIPLGVGQGTTVKRAILDKNTRIGNNVVIANSAAIAGHAQISDDVIIGGNCGIQQFTRIGRMAMIGGMSGVSRDVIPYGLSFGNRNYLEGINLIGLRRKKVSNKEILALSEAYKEIFKTNSLHENLAKLSKTLKNNSYVREVVDFINHDKKRPICTPLSK